MQQPNLIARATSSSFGAGASLASPTIQRLPALALFLRQLPDPPSQELPNAKRAMYKLLTTTIGNWWDECEGLIQDERNTRPCTLGEQSFTGWKTLVQQEILPRLHARNTLTRVDTVSSLVGQVLDEGRIRFIAQTGHRGKRDHQATTQQARIHAHLEAGSGEVWADSVSTLIRAGIGAAVNTYWSMAKIALITYQQQYGEEMSRDVFRTALIPLRIIFWEVASAHIETLILFRKCADSYLQEALTGNTTCEKFLFSAHHNIPTFDMSADEKASLRKALKLKFEDRRVKPRIGCPLRDAKATVLIAGKKQTVPVFNRLCNWMDQVAITYLYDADADNNN